MRRRRDVDPGVSGRHRQEQATERRRQADDRRHRPGPVREWGVEGVFPRLRTRDGEGGAGECGDVFGGRVGASGYEQDVLSMVGGRLSLQD